MPVPYQATPHAPYPTYVAPMPQSFNPYATLPYPQSELQTIFIDYFNITDFCLCFSDPYNYQNFPQGPQTQNYGTYPGAYAQQQQPPPPQGYPHGYPHGTNWPPQ